MIRPTTLVIAAHVLLLPGAAVRAEASATTQPATTEVRHLQGAWEGVLVGEEAAGKVTISFSGDSLHYQGPKADQWYDASFSLREGTRPRQLRATITANELGRDVGKVIGAVFKIENGTLSLAGIEDGAPSTLDDSAAFDGNTMFHYRFRKAEPQAKKDGAPKISEPETQPSSAPWSPLPRSE